MKIGHVASEISPLAKVGGLADVVYGLSQASLKAGHEVFVILPEYAHLKKDLSDAKASPPIQIEAILTYSYKQICQEGVTLYFVNLHTPHFNRDTIYGGSDETLFFLYFAKAAAHLLLKLHPVIAHGHDWQAAFALFELKKQKSQIKSLLTLHNLQYQGKIPKEALLQVGQTFPLPSWMCDPDHPDLANLLKIGIESADRITTVSKSYHDQLLEQPMAFGLEAVLLAHRHKFLGILNGIDTTFFNPFTDMSLYQKYPKEALNDPLQLKKAKLANLKALLLEHKKPYDERFTLCSITRLSEQKAPELIVYALKKTLELEGRFILIGSLHGSPDDKHLIQALAPYEHHPHVLCQLNTDTQMAHRVYAAASALIVPSHFEPCGLTQMIALRYGTIPLVRATGGLKDTVFDVDTSELIEEKRNGFTFDHPDTGGVDWVIERCKKLYQTPQLFYALSLKNMHEDHSWEKAALPYLHLYTLLALSEPL